MSGSSAAASYRSFEERLISRTVLQELLQSGALIAIDPDFERSIASRRTLLDTRLAAVDAKAKDGFAARRRRRHLQPRDFSTQLLIGVVFIIK